MYFKDWLSKSALKDFWAGNLPESVFISIADILFNESEEEDLFRQGYRLIKAKYATPKLGIQVGDPIYYKQGMPVIPARAASRQAPPQTTQPPQQKTYQGMPNKDSGEPNQGEWVYAKVSAKTDERFPLGKELAVQQRPDGGWNYLVLAPGFSTQRGILSPSDIKNGVIQSIRLTNNNVIRTRAPSLEDLKNRYEGGDAATEQPKQEEKPKGKTTTIPDEMISDEQKAIDEKFKKMMEGDAPNHLSIEALAGTGKTTMLQHLAWKYGNPSQKWLYLVFNKRNRVEAKSKFPNFVTVETTNSFLGKLLGSKENLSRITQTDRMVDMGKFGRKKGDDEGGSKNLEKVRIIVDSTEFSGLMSKFGIPENISCPTCKGSLSKDKYHKDLVCSNCRDEPFGGTGNTIASLLKSIQYHFKEQVVVMTNLAKSFVLDPREPEKMTAGMDSIIDDYDLDTALGEVKDRIAKYKGSFGKYVQQYLKELLGYDFMSKDYADEIKQATSWALHESLPGQSSLTYKKGSDSYNLSDFRDWGDDIYYPALKSKDIHWPKYDVVLADEGQDFNAGQRIVLEELAKAGAKIVFVGDRHQAIYAFRGGDAESFENVTKSLTGLSTDKNSVHSITKNFRSKPKILEFATQQTGIKGLQSGKKWAEGDEGVVTDGELKYEDAFEQLKAERDSGKVMETAFISRTNEPLVHAALKMLGSRLPFVIIGKDLSNDLNRHIAKIAARMYIQDNSPIYDLEEKLEQFRNEEQDAHYGKATKAPYLSELNETTDAILSCISQFEKEEPQGTVGQFKIWIKQRLGGLDFEEGSERSIEKNMAEYEERMRKEKPTVLVSGHRSKGLEFSRVFILRSDQWPHPKAKKPKQRVQENNNKYVSLTRAKDELHVLDLDGQPGYQPKEQDQ